MVKYDSQKIDYQLYIDFGYYNTFVMNDELWNLMPMDSSLNSSKSNRLPQWDKFFIRFAQNYYVDVNCTYKSKNHAEFYLKELDALTKEEGIEYQLIAIYDDKMNKREYRWPIPGSMRIENVINVVAGIYIFI